MPRNPRPRPQPDPPPRQKLLNLQETIAYCGISDASVYRWTEEGYFPPPRLRRPGRFVRWHVDDLDAWLAGKTDWKT
jgi:predicted DNA-binding transcriptional regulator AlpA